MIGIALLLFAAAASGQPAQTFQLQSGDFRWIPFTVRQTPTGVNCHFEVVGGGPTVHAELLPISEFRRFDRGREHDTMATTPKARAAEFRRVIDTRGQYAIVIANEKGAGPVTVSLTVETNVNPSGDDVARTLSPERRLTVMLLSFVFFVGTVSWSTRKLIVAMKRNR